MAIMRETACWGLGLPHCSCSQPDSMATMLPSSHSPFPLRLGEVSTDSDRKHGRHPTHGHPHLWPLGAEKGRALFMMMLVRKTKPQTPTLIDLMLKVSFPLAATSFSVGGTFPHPDVYLNEWQVLGGAKLCPW